MEVRPAEERELDALARVWLQAWNDAHAHIVPPEPEVASVTLGVSGTGCTPRSRKPASSARQVRRSASTF